MVEEIKAAKDTGLCPKCAAPLVELNYSRVVVEGGYAWPDEDCETAGLKETWSEVEGGILFYCANCTEEISRDSDEAFEIMKKAKEVEDDRRAKK